MKLIIDAREKKPYGFCGFKGIETLNGTLKTGDYSLEGLENEIAIERKSLDDLANCLGGQRDRFVNEMLRSRGLRRFCVVVEANWEDLVNGNYRSKINPASASGTIMWLQSAGIQFAWVGNRKNGEKFVFDFFRHYLKHEHKRAVSIIEGVTPVDGDWNGCM